MKSRDEQTKEERQSKNHKYIFVIGGVMSGVGKGVATSSIGTLLSAQGFSVNLVKVDPYLNVDAGTMNPTEHGEVFVLNSGLETDQDMGNYERFLNRDASAADYMTSGHDLQGGHRPRTFSRLWRKMCRSRAAYPRRDRAPF